MSLATTDRGLASGLMTVSQLGTSNRVGLLYSLAERGPSSRSELARIAGVPRGSIAPIVAGLLEDELLVELEPTTGHARMGKPSRPLWFGPRVGHSGTVRIEAERVECARVDQRGEVNDIESAAFPANPTRQQIEDTVASLAVTVFGRSTQPLSGIGLVWPALWDRDTGVVLSCTPIPSLAGSNIVQRLRDACGLEVHVEDDARALAIGERWFGQGRGVEDFAAVQISTGIGAGLIVAGRLFSVEGRFPEVGHMVVQLDGTVCRCGRRGCWETIAALGWLRLRARELGMENHADLTPEDIATHPSPAAHQLLEDYARNISTGLVNISMTLGITRFLLHGEVIGGGEALLEMLRQQIAAQSTLPGRTPPVVEFSALDQRAALLGAAAIPLVHAIEHA